MFRRQKEADWIAPAQEEAASLQGGGWPRIASNGVEATASGAAPQIHEVQRGETLSEIAERYYGKAAEYRKVLEANRDQLDDHQELREGMQLRIP